MTICNCDEFNTDVTFSGNIELGGAIAKIGGRTNVGITGEPARRPDPQLRWDRLLVQRNAGG